MSRLVGLAIAWACAVIAPFSAHAQAPYPSQGANSPAAEKQMRAAGVEPAGGNAEALDKALKREIAKVNEVVKTAGIEPQ
jgi:hypothetical protein